MRRRAALASALAVALLGAVATTLPASSSASTTRAKLDKPEKVCVTATATSPGTTPVTVCTSWKPRDTWRGASTPIYAITFRPDPSRLVDIAYAAWIRTSGTDLALYPGYKNPGASSLSPGPEEVPLSGRGRLLATFNSGFYEKNGPAGFYVNGTLYDPMVKGLATVVRYRDGTVNVAPWTGGATPGQDVLMARQNLTLLVSKGRPTPLTANDAQTVWGFTLGGRPAVWRTALGVTSSGDLVYAAAPDQTAASLAQVMVLLHCVRAMELDINPSWAIFVTYGGPGAFDPALDVPNPNEVPGRFLSQSTKDFFAVFVAKHPGEAQPW